MCPYRTIGRETEDLGFMEQLQITRNSKPRAVVGVNTDHLSESSLALGSTPDIELVDRLDISDVCPGIPRLSVYESPYAE